MRRAESGGDISISGNKKIKSLEKEFDTVFGLYCQICFTTGDGKRYYTNGSNDEKHYLHSTQSAKRMDARKASGNS